MNPKTRKKVLIDIAMTVIFLLLMNLSLTGVFLHEWLGVIFVALFVSHLAINAQWISNVGRRLFKPLAARPKALFVLNALLTVSMLLTLGSGVLISQYLFAPLAAANFDLWYTLHTVSSWVTLGVIITHTLLHWTWIRNVIRQAVKNPALQPVRLLAARSLVGLFALGAVYSMIINPTVDLIVAGRDSTDTDKNQLLTQSTSITAAAGAETQTGTEVIEPIPTTQEPAITTQTATEAVPTLQEYLSSFTCTLCHRHCLLSNPRCAKGVRQQSEYEQKYYDTYDVTTTN